MSLNATLNTSHDQHFFPNANFLFLLGTTQGASFYLFGMIHRQSPTFSNVGLYTTNSLLAGFYREWSHEGLES